MNLNSTKLKTGLVGRKNLQCILLRKMKIQRWCIYTRQWKYANKKSDDMGDKGNSMANVVFFFIILFTVEECYCILLYYGQTPGIYLIFHSINCSVFCPEVFKNYLWQCTSKLNYVVNIYFSIVKVVWLHGPWVCLLVTTVIKQY